MERTTPKDRPLFLVLSLCTSPVSLDDLLAWDFAKAIDLWRILDDGRKRGLLVETTDRSGHFAWADEKTCEPLWLDASIEDWQAALVHPDIIGRAIGLVHQAVERRDRRRAMALYRGLVQVRQPERFPGGEIGFMRTVAESCTLFIHAEWRPADVVERALDIAERLGDRPTEAWLLGVRSNLFFYAGDLRMSLEFMERFHSIASTLDDPKMALAANIGLALTRILAGQIRDGIASFEAFLGDVPQEVLPAIDDLFGLDLCSSIEMVATVGLAYSLMGQPTRAVDLLQRSMALGERAGSEDATNVSRLFLGCLSISHGDFLPGRRWGAFLLDYWQGAGNRPFFAWFAAILVAAIHRQDGRIEDARAALAIGHEARTRSGFPYYFGRELLDLLEWLENNEAAPIDGLTLKGEIDRGLLSENGRTRGLAHHFEARRLRRAGIRDGVEQHLLEGGRLLNAAGAVPDLALILEDRASWERQQGRMVEAQELEIEVRDLRQSISPLVPLEAPRDRSGGRLAVRVMELGRLSAIGAYPGVWGEIAGRMCSLLSADRCAIVEGGASPRLLALRGGSERWGEAVVRQATRVQGENAEFLEPPSNEEDASENGQLLVVPFRTRGFKRSGWVALENRWTQPLLGPEDRPLLEALGLQLSVLLENATLWQELQTARARLEQETRYYREEDRASVGATSMVGHSRALQEMLQLVSRVAPTDSTVLITGETGAGKELVARELHRLSARTGGPFIPVHIASLAPGLVASSLFGHERGAFTGATEQVRGRFELASGGTIFLDEVGELGPEEQVRLLRVLQDGTFERVGGTRPLRSDFRLLAATNRDLGGEVAAGRFREDLFYRLNAFPVHVPALRDRSEDIPTLALYFMEQCARQLGRRFDGISEADMTQLQAYPWPGNVRELMHVIERAAVLSDGPRLRIPPLAQVQGPPVMTGVASAEQGMVSLAEAERRHVRRVLQHVRGRVTGTGGAAEILGLKPSTLHFKIAKLGLRADLTQARQPGRSRATTTRPQ